MSIKKVVLAYSGGLDTSAIVPWLKDNYDCEVIAFVANVGQGDEELAGVEQKAIKSGASSCHVVDLREELIKEVKDVHLLGIRSKTQITTKVLEADFYIVWLAGFCMHGVSLSPAPMFVGEFLYFFTIYQ